MSTSSADRQAKIRAAAPKQRSKAPLIAALLVLLILAGAITWAVLANSSQKDSVAKAAANVTVPPHGTKAKDGIVVNPGKAKAGAPVVALFQDYQCPVCKVLEDQYGSYLEHLATAGRIQLEYHTMTFLDGNLRNDASTRAAQAAACADVVGAYAKYHDAIYTNQPAQEGAGYTDEQLRTTFAKEAGITGDKLVTFEACYDDKKMANWVTGTQDAASKAGVNGTPTIRVNGKDFDYRQPFSSEADFAAKLLAAGR